MTKENRERAYKHFRDQEKNYVAPEGKNHSCTATDVVRVRCKWLADRLRLKNPELSLFDEPKEVKEEVLTPVQKAARTKAANRAKKAAEEAAKKAEETA